MFWVSKILIRNIFLVELIQLKFYTVVIHCIPILYNKDQPTNS